MIKKTNITNKTIAMLLAVSLPLTILAGCQNKKTAVNATSGATANSGNNDGNTQKGSAPNLDQFKQRMAENIKSLVDDKTITQEQADKIVAALTENMQGFGGRQKNSQNGQNNNQNNQNGSQNNGQGNSQNNNRGNAQNGQNNGQNRQNGRTNQESSALNKLVTDKVITQAQADAVMQKIRGNFNRPQNNQDQQNNNNNNNNNNNTNGNQGA